MANENEKLLPNHQDALDIVTALNAIAAANIAGGGSGTLTMDKLLVGIKNGVAKNLVNVGDELTFNESPSLSTIVAVNTVEGVTCGVTSETCDVDTFVAKTGVSSGVSMSFFYYGSAWHKDSIIGDVVTLSEYGISIVGTPVANDCITVAIATSKFTMQVADFDHYTPANASVAHHVVLTAKDCIRGSQQFANNPELAFANTKAIIPAGKYKITTKTAGDDDKVVDGDFVFTTTVAIPLGGGFYVDVIGTYYGSGNKDRVPTTVKTYAADHATVLETLTLSVYNSSTDTDAVDMGTYSREYDSTLTYQNTYGYVNFSRRVAYGSGDYSTSIYRLWINAKTAKATWWKQMSIFALKPSNAWVDQVAGWLYNMDSDLIKGLKKAKVNYYMSDSDYNLMTALSLSKPVQYPTDDTVSVSGRIITCEDYVFPLSIVEVGLGSQYNDNLANNTVLALYDGASNNDRIKYYSSAAKYWWLRSTHPWYCHDAALVIPSGALNSHNAYIANGVVPACIIG